MRLTRLGGLFAVLFFNISLFAQSDATLAWPTNAGKVMTSSLGEYRPGHFHAGLDFKTWGRDGYEVYAVSGGWVSRIKTSPYGYGRALYVRLDDGRTAVYAHLSRYIWPVEAEVRKKQRAAGHYSVDLWLGKNQLRVEKGQLIAWTGSTGNGQPHLHFELRNRRSHALNPLNEGLPVEDTRPPLFKNFAAMPLDSSGRVDGFYLPRTWPLVRLASGQYWLRDTVNVSGQIGFAVEAVDKADGAYNPFAPYITRFFIDDSCCFARQFDEIPFSETHWVEEDYDYWLKRNGSPNHQRLFKVPGNPMGLYTMNGGRFSDEWGRPDFQYLSPGLHQFRVECLDYAGNRSVARGWIRVGAVPPQNHAQTEITMESATHFDLSWQLYGHSIVFTIDGSSAHGEAPALMLRSQAWQSRSIPLTHVSATRWQGQVFLQKAPAQWLEVELLYLNDHWRYENQRQSIELYTVYPDGGCVIHSADSRLELSVPSGAVEEPLLMALESTMPEALSELSLPVYRLYPKDLRFKRPAQLTVKMPEVLYGPGWGLAVPGNGGDDAAWIIPAAENGSAALQLRVPGDYTWAQDTVGTEIVWIQPGHGAVTQQPSPVIRIKVAHRFSGFSGENDYSVSLDGQPLIVERVPHQQMLLAPVWRTLSPGLHSLEIVLKDRAGNVTKHASEFTVRTP